jgi:hypothetical protein
MAEYTEADTEVGGIVMISLAGSWCLKSNYFMLCHCSRNMENLYAHLLSQ